MPFHILLLPLLLSICRYFSTWPCWPLIPVDLSSLISSHSLPTFVQPSLLAPRMVTLSPEVLWNGQWDLLTDDLSCIWWMCDVLLRVALKPCGQGLRATNRTILLFLMGPSSVLPSGTCDWKAIMWSPLRRSHFRNVVIIAERVPDMMGRSVFLCVGYTISSDKFDIIGIQITIHVFLHILGKTCICGFHQWSLVTAFGSLEASLHRWHNGWGSIVSKC